MTYIERLKKVDDFFNNISVEEFEKKLESAGILEIEPSSNADMEFLIPSRVSVDQNRNSIYIPEKNDNNEFYNSYTVSKNYPKAV